MFLCQVTHSTVMYRARKVMYFLATILNDNNKADVEKVEDPIVFIQGYKYIDMSGIAS